MKATPAMFAIFMAVTFCVLKLCSCDTVINMGLLFVSFISSVVICRVIRMLSPQHNLPDLHNKAVLITGCSSGFGLGLAKKFDKLGMTVYATMRNPQCAGAQDLRSTCSNRLHVVTLDITKDDDVAQTVKYVKDTIKDKVFWAVINNAGASDVGDVELAPLDQLRQLFETNVFGYVRVTKAFLPLIRRSRGRIVCVGSLTSHVVPPALTYYSMTKHAVKALVDGLRREMSTWSVSVHEVDPHIYRTVMAEEGTVLKKVEECWNNAPDDVKQDYGPLQLQIYKYMVQIFLNQSNSNIEEVLDDIVDAAVGTEPQNRYIPGFRPKCEMALFKYLPIAYQDYLLELFLIWGGNRLFAELKKSREEFYKSAKKNV